MTGKYLPYDLLTHTLYHLQNSQTPHVFRLESANLTLISLNLLLLESMLFIQVVQKHGRFGRCKSWQGVQRSCLVLTYGQKFVLSVDQWELFKRLYLNKTSPSFTYYIEFDNYS